MNRHGRINEHRAELWSHVQANHPDAPTQERQQQIAFKDFFRSIGDELRKSVGLWELIDASIQAGDMEELATVLEAHASRTKDPETAEALREVAETLRAGRVDAGALVYAWERANVS